jgi:hypothetical protein
VRRQAAATEALAQLAGSTDRPSGMAVAVQVGLDHTAADYPPKVL